MPIGLNYTHEHVAGGLLLPNYVYALNCKYPITRADLFSGDERETQKFLGYVQENKLKEVLQDKEHTIHFDAPEIQDILLAAYPYEVTMKCLRQEVADDTQLNELLIGLFNSFFDIDYHRVVDEYVHSGRKETCARFVGREERTYTDRDTVVRGFMDFLDTLFRSQGYEQEAAHICTYMEQHLHLSFVEGISGVTSERGGEVYIEVGNDTYITIFHELVHFVNRYFRYHYYEDNEVCFDHFTRTNEGLANFVAYHCLDQIIDNNIADISHIFSESLFVSSYIDIYATLREEGTMNRQHNYDLIVHEMKKFEGELLTPEKSDFYYQRFYKFFHYDQHTYLYPKELMYHIGYHDIRKLFVASNNKQQLLTQCLLGKICL